MMFTKTHTNVFELFEQNNFEIRYVGGCVRDWTLGVQPKDVDFSTTATPNQMIELFETNGLRYIPTGLQHGTITLEMNDEFFEITTLRIDEVCDGRHAEVSFTNDWKKDAERRDFTYNAMSMNSNGKIFDYFNGLEDLRNHRTVFVGDAASRIREDALRILRFFRFSTRFNQFDAPTMNIIASNIQLLSNISIERVWMELEKIFKMNCDTTLQFMMDCGVLEFYNIDLNVVDHRKHWLHKVADCFSSTTLKQFKVSNDIRDVVEFVQNHTAPWDTKSIALKLVFASNKESMANNIRHSLDYNNQNVVFDIPDCPVNGETLIKEGFKPSKEFGLELKKRMTDWVNANF